MTKPGYKTTECWTSVASLAIAGLVQVGVVPLSDVQHLAAVAGSTASTMWLAGQYIAGRNKLKAGEYVAHSEVAGNA